MLQEPSTGKMFCWLIFKFKASLRCIGLQWPNTDHYVGNKYRANSTNNINIYKLNCISSMTALRPTVTNKKPIAFSLYMGP